MLNNPPFPTGCQLLAQSAVTAEMTSWAVQILRDRTHYPMFATATREFGQRIVLARVEWHAADARNPRAHRGVTLHGRRVNRRAEAPAERPGFG